MDNKKKNALPTGTRSGIVLGLGVVTSAKWKLFLKEGPYWNCMASLLTRGGLFKGYFRAFPKTVVRRTGLDLLRKGMRPHDIPTILCA